MSAWALRVLLALVPLALACTRAEGRGGASPQARSTDPAAVDYVGPALPTARVSLPDAFGGRHVVTVEVADTPDSRTRGLMWRNHLPDGQGMLFIFPAEEVQSFWMRNTLIPLDMLFINQAHQVVGIVEEAQPQTLSPRGVGRPSLYVLEVPGGWAARTGVRAGATVGFEGVPPAPRE